MGERTQARQRLEQVDRPGPHLTGEPQDLPLAQRERQRGGEGRAHHLVEFHREADAVTSGTGGKQGLQPVAQHEGDDAIQVVQPAISSGP